MNRSTFWLAIVAALGWHSAHAHDTWLAPADFDVKRRTTMTLTLSSGMEFPKLDHAIHPERVEIARLRTSRGKVVDLSRGSAGEHALEFHQKLSTPGTTMFWSVLHPRPSALKPEQVKEYIEHLGVRNAASVLSEWNDKAVKYRYTKFAKTFVRVGGGGGNAWREPAGMRLELIPLTDPSRARAGDAVKLRLISDGRALTGYPVAVSSDGTEKNTYTTDDSGVVTVDIPAAGRYMIKAATLANSSASGVDWDVDFTTLTFEAGERQRR